MVYTYSADKKCKQLTIHTLDEVRKKRLANTTITTAERNAQYSYDTQGNLTSVLDNHLSPNAQYSFQYDTLNRLSQQISRFLPTAVTQVLH